MAQKRRHMAKALTYRVMGTCITSLSGWIITGSWQIGVLLGPVDALAKVALYYVHESFWDRIKWGLCKQQED